MEVVLSLDQVMPEPIDGIQPPQLSEDSSATDPSVLESRVNLNQMLSLINSILPFEACLFYQIIPLSIESSHLNLGMVNPKDLEANDYARRQISYIHYSMVAWPITSDWHRQTLSKYLSYAAKLKQRLRQGQSAMVNPVLSSPLADRENQEVDDRLTYIVDSPEKITLDDTKLGEPSTDTRDSPPVPETEPTEPSVSTTAPLTSTLPPLVFNPVASPGEIHQLSPKALLEVLLQQVLSAGIGRLYFEHRSPRGRVVYSQDGQVRSILDDLDGTLLKDVITELKQLAGMPTLPASGNRQAEIERLYNGEPVLLRLRAMPNAEGENATLQILRGAALKFYQRQQINDLSREALIFAQHLQNRLQVIYDRSNQKLLLESLPLDTLVTLHTLLNTMTSQAHQLMNRQQSQK
ncbi:MAG: hypothetical protein LVS60_17255 [Nodosilinea sp. LVE1205-7]|jgi:type II secretory ATPase GspE/PulE/Tfp pilus assembly ATPase PilB-like protein